MNTRELVRVMTDGTASINSIHNLLVACGRDHDEVMEAILEMAGSDEYTSRTVRKVYYHNTTGEEVEVREIVYVPVKE